MKPEVSVFHLKVQVTKTWRFEKVYYLLMEGVKMFWVWNNMNINDDRILILGELSFLE